jgi:hypothetical protein
MMTSTDLNTASVRDGLARLVADIAASDGTAAVEIAGVRIERCDEYGQTATTIDLEQTRLDLAAVEETANAAGALVGQLRGQLDDVKRVARRLRNYRGGFKQDAAMRADIADLIDAALDGTLDKVMLP